MKISKGIYSLAVVICSQQWEWIADLNLKRSRRVLSINVGLALLVTLSWSRAVRLEYIAVNINKNCNIIIVKYAELIALELNNASKNNNK